jgi:cysteine desulfurase
VTYGYAGLLGVLDETSYDVGEELTKGFWGIHGECVGGLCGGRKADPWAICVGGWGISLPVCGMVYLDSNATSQIDPAVVDAMLPYLREQYANPSSAYKAGRMVKGALQVAREQVAALLNARPGEIIFTSCGTESNNAAIESAMRIMWPTRQRLVVAAAEHSAVLEPARRWAAAGGKVTRLVSDGHGQISLMELGAVLGGGDVALVSIMWANNETGVLAQVADITAMAHAAGALMHTDAVQAVGKVPVDVVAVPVDYLSLSGHKFHAPKGVGALYASSRVRFVPSMLGGGQEAGRRSGTENVPYIVGLGLAAELMRRGLDDGTEERVRCMRDAFERRLMEGWPGLLRNGHATERLPTTTSVAFPGLPAAEMLLVLDERGVCCSAGSACHSASVHPSHVLEAMGLSAEHAASTVRFSLSRFNKEDEVMAAAGTVLSVAHKLLSLKGDVHSLVETHS